MMGPDSWPFPLPWLQREPLPKWGLFFVVGVEHHEGTNSFHFVPFISRSLSLSHWYRSAAPASMHFRISRDVGFAACSLLEGEGTILFRSFAACSSDMVRVADVPHMGTHCAMSH